MQNQMGTRSISFKELMTYIQLRKMGSMNVWLCLKKNNKQLELVDKVYCSKLIRAKQTCEIIASSIHFKGEIIYTSIK